MTFKNAKFGRHIDYGIAYKLCTTYAYKTNFEKFIWAEIWVYVCPMDLTKTDWTRHTCFQNVQKHNLITGKVLWNVWLYKAVDNYRNCDHCH